MQVGRLLLCCCARGGEPAVVGVPVVVGVSVVVVIVAPVVVGRWREVLKELQRRKPRMMSTLSS